MRATMFAFALIALSMHLYARQAAPGVERADAGSRVAVVAGSPIVLR